MIFSTTNLIFANSFDFTVASVGKFAPAIFLSTPSAAPFFVKVEPLKWFVQQLGPSFGWFPII